jgi:hypothetical protein
MAVTEETAEQIKKDAQAGVGYQELAKKYKVSIKDLAKIIKGDEPPPPGKPTLTAEGFIEYTIVLPAAAFDRFEMAKQFEFIKDGDMTFDQWVFECIDRRFTADYGVEIVIQPIATKRATIEEMVNQAVQKAMAAEKALVKVPEKGQEG